MRDLENLVKIDWKNYLDHKSNFKDCHYHFIAPLQSRKIPEILENSKSVHTVSRLKEVEKIDLLYKNHEIFVQINIDNDPKKSGINPNDVQKFFEKFENYSFFPNGIMCIPDINSDPRESFKNMNDINQKLFRYLQTIQWRTIYGNVC